MIEHITFDVRSGRITYVVLARNGVFGNGEKQHAIPWNALAMNARRSCFVLKIDTDILRKSDSFVSNQWPCAPGSSVETDREPGYVLWSNHSPRAW